MEVHIEYMGKPVFFLSDGQIKRGIVNYISHSFYKDYTESVLYYMDVEGEGNRMSKLVFPTLKEAIEYISAPIKCDVEDMCNYIKIEHTF